MALTYTEKIASFSIGVNLTWTDYDLFTNQGVPKGAVAEIVCANKNTGAVRDAGVRTDGSTLGARRITLHEAEGDGVTTATMFVKCDSSSGLIECYAEVAADIDFYLLGYFEGCDFTEKIDDLGLAPDAWADKDLTANGVPSNAVVQIMMVNAQQTIAQFLGARENGSELERGIVLDEAEEGGHSVLSMIVKVDADKIYEWKGVGFFTDHYLLGYFSSTVDFTEGLTQYVPASDDTWESKTITEADASSIVAFALVHNDFGKETYCGLRSEGGSLSRYIEEHEAEGGGDSGFEACITLDADKKCEVYCQDASEANFYYTGYFTEISGATYTKTFDTDALLLKRQTATFQTDGWLLKRQSKTWVADAFLRYLQTKQFTTDSMLLKRQTATFDADAILKVIQTKTFDADAYLTKRGTKPFDVDALLLKRQTKPFTADAILLSELSKGFTTDGWLLKRAAKTFDVDAVLRYKQTKTFDVDGWLLQRQTTSFTSDAVLHYLQTKTFTVDAQLLQRQTKAFTADAILRVLTGKAFSVDGWLLKRQTKTFDADAILAVLGVKGFTADGWLLKRQTKQFTTDAHLRYIQTATFTSDGWLLKRATKAFSSDAWLVKAGSKGFLTDAILLKTFTKTFTSDAILQDIGVQGFTTDGWLLQRQTKQFTTDSWLLKRQTKPFTVDAILESLYHKGFTVDAWLLKRQTVTFTSDAILIYAGVTPTAGTYGGPVARPELPVHFVYLLRKLLEDYLEYEDVPFAEKTL